MEKQNDKYLIDVNILIFEIQNYISIFENKYPDLKIFFTGGDTIFFENKLKKNIFAKHIGHRIRAKDTINGGIFLKKTLSTH